MRARKFRESERGAHPKARRQEDFAPLKPAEDGSQRGNVRDALLTPPFSLR